MAPAELIAIAEYLDVMAAAVSLLPAPVTADDPLRPFDPGWPEATE